VTLTSPPGQVSLPCRLLLGTSGRTRSWNLLQCTHVGEKLSSWSTSRLLDLERYFSGKSLPVPINERVQCLSRVHAKRKRNLDPPPCWKNTAIASPKKYWNSYRSCTVPTVTIRNWFINVIRQLSATPPRKPSLEQRELNFLRANSAPHLTDVRTTHTTTFSVPAHTLFTISIVLPAKSNANGALPLHLEQYLLPKHTQLVLSLDRWYSTQPAELFNEQALGHL